MTIFKRNIYIYFRLNFRPKYMYIFPPEDGHKTETCSGYWITYSKQCCVRRKPWTWPSTRNRMQTTNFNIVDLHRVAHCYYTFTSFFRLCAACQCLKHSSVFKIFKITTCFGLNWPSSGVNNCFLRRRQSQAGKKTTRNRHTENKGMNEHDWIK
jgi:hypothetical protein